MVSSSSQTYLAAIVLLAVLVPSIVCPPVKPDEKDNKKDHEKKKEHPDRNDELFNLEYAEYLKQVKDALESDEEFLKRLKAMNTTTQGEYGLEYERYLKEIFTALEQDETFKNKIMKDPEMKAKDISQHLDFVSHSVRTKLDEIKRTEVERLRQLIHLKVQQLKVEQGHQPLPGRTLEQSIKHLLPESEHLDIKNPHSFEMSDLDKLIKKATGDLESLDKERKEDFKKYEMEKEHERRQRLAKMTPEERKKEEEHFQEMKKKHAEHPKLHEPGSKAQLEEVWEEEDHMDKDTFDPQTFFKMHDIDEDGHLEPDEVEALVEKEVAKAYEPGNEEDDLNEKYEEINRMREEMFKRYDKNHDGLISNQEFIEMTKTKDFEEDDGWKDLDEQEIYTPEELAEFEKEREAEDSEDENDEHPDSPHEAFSHHEDPHQDVNSLNPAHEVPPHDSQLEPERGKSLKNQVAEFLSRPSVLEVTYLAGATSNLLLLGSENNENEAAQEHHEQLQPGAVHMDQGAVPPVPAHVPDPAVPAQHAPEHAAAPAQTQEHHPPQAEQPAAVEKHAPPQHPPPKL